MPLPNTIGRYEIKAELGRGGMATVYRAHDPRFKREVAIKVLPREFLHDLQFRARFEREAETIAALEHPAIVPVYDFGEDADTGQPYIVMRLMTGGSLANRLERGPLPLVEAARIFSRLAPALDKAHAKGIIHRDLKPGNILFDDDENPCISDFGIAKLTEGTASLTGTGVVGTPAYMSPEQARGERGIDGRSDLYALGTIVFQMLTGKLPYESDTPMGIAIKHIIEPTPHILETRPDLPRGCEDLIQKAMAKNRDERFTTAGELARALETAIRFAPPLPSEAAVSHTAEITREAPALAVEEAPAVETPNALPIVADAAEISEPLAEPLAETLQAIAVPIEVNEAAPLLAPVTEVESPTLETETRPAQPRAPRPLARFALPAAGIAAVVLLMMGGAVYGPRVFSPATATPTVMSAVMVEVSPSPTPTPSPSPSPTLTSPRKPTANATPRTPRPTATPLPIVVFADPLLAAIANQKPDFQDDFSDRTGGWTKGGWCADWRLKYVDGEMVVSDCHVSREMWHADFVVEMDVRFLPGSPSDSQMRFHYRSGGSANYFVDLEYGGAVEIGLEEPGSPGKYTRIPDAGPGSTANHHVLVIVKDQSLALFVNDRPVYYGALPAGWKNGGMLWSFGDTMAFDNFKVWDISNLPLAATPTP